MVDNGMSLGYVDGGNDVSRGLSPEDVFQHFDQLQQFLLSNPAFSDVCSLILHQAPEDAFVSFSSSRSSQIQRTLETLSLWMYGNVSTFSHESSLLDIEDLFSSLKELLSKYRLKPVGGLAQKS
ncbi:hypothetical protein GEMRC1_005137 [Eukaryota sp. GEM-RC1]